jgi:hypothetical protein
LLKDDVAWVLLGNVGGTGCVQITDDQFGALASIHFANGQAKAGASA